jgi:D-methionine transport system permease protein
VGIRFGYQRFDPTVMLATVVLLLVLVQLILSEGESLDNTCDHR